MTVGPTTGRGVDGIDARFVATLRATVSSLGLDGEVLVLDEHQGRTLLLEGTAAVVWRCLDGISTVAEISEDIAEAYQAPVTSVTGDVLALVAQLGALGLLEGIEPPRPRPPDPPVSLDVGSELPQLDVTDLDDAPVRVGDLPGRVVLVNWSPRCGWCVKLAPDLAAQRQALDDAGVALVLLTGGSAEENQALLDDTGLFPDRVLLLGERPNTVFPGVGTPAAYEIVDGRVAAPLAVGKPPVEDLAKAACART